MSVGLLHLKCRRGSVPEPRSVTTQVALSVPLAQQAKFLATRPLFFIEGDTLNLAMGWPEGVTAAQLRNPRIDYR